MWGWIITIAVIVYIVGFLFTFWVFSRMGGLISFGLCLMRAAVWPIFWTIGWPSGERLPMD